MKLNYKINNKNHKIIFCPDREGLKITNKKKSYTIIAKDLLKNYNDRKVLLIVDKNIDKKIISYLIHDLDISFKNLEVIRISGSKKNKDTKLLFKIIDFLIEKKFTKKSVIISTNIRSRHGSMCLRHYHGRNTIIERLLSIFKYSCYLIFRFIIGN